VDARRLSGSKGSLDYGRKGDRTSGVKRGICLRLLVNAWARREGEQGGVQPQRGKKEKWSFPASLNGGTEKSKGPPFKAFSGGIFND